MWWANKGSAVSEERQQERTLTTSSSTNERTNEIAEYLMESEIQYLWSKENKTKKKKEKKNNNHNRYYYMFRSDFVRVFIRWTRVHVSLMVYNIPWFRLPAIAKVLFLLLPQRNRSKEVGSECWALFYYFLQRTFCIRMEYDEVNRYTLDSIAVDKMDEINECQRAIERERERQRATQRWNVDTRRDKLWMRKKEARCEKLKLSVRRMK